MNTSLFVGLDIGQSSDYTAMTVLERAVVGPPAVYHLRYVQRFPLHMPYPDMFVAMKTIVTSSALANLCTLLVDATGVGKPVVDILRREKLPVKLVPVTITGGNVTTADATGYHVPKRDLATAVKLLLDGERLKINPKMQHAQLLLAELQKFRVKINTKTAHDSYEAWREGDHDDLVLSLAMACWYAERKKAQKQDATLSPPSPITVTKKNEAIEEITYRPVPEADRLRTQEGWSWNDLQQRGSRV